MSFWEKNMKMGMRKGRKFKKKLKEVISRERKSLKCIINA
jgi:hypothetical protein